MRIVIKVGTSTLAHKTGHLNIRMIETLCKVISDLKNAGHEIILVSSGAIGMGTAKLNLKERPHDIAGKQAAAAGSRAFKGLAEAGSGAAVHRLHRILIVVGLAGRQGAAAIERGGKGHTVAEYVVTGGAGYGVPAEFAGGG